MAGSAPSARSDKLPLIGVIVVILISMGAAAWFLLSSRKADESPQPQGSAQTAEHMQSLAEQGRQYREQVRQEELRRQAEEQAAQALAALPGLIEAHNDKDACRTDADCTVLRVGDCCDYAVINKASAPQFPEVGQKCREACRRPAAACVRKRCAAAKRR